MDGHDLSGWDFSDQDLTAAHLDVANLSGAGLRQAILTNARLSYSILSGADLRQATLTDADVSFATLTGADLRGATVTGRQLATANTNNAILPNGQMMRLDLAAGERLVVRDHDLPVVVVRTMTVRESAALEVDIADAEWGSTIQVRTGALQDLGGTLVLNLDAVDQLDNLVGTRFRLFDWNEPLLPNERFDDIEVPAGTQWDLSRLYTTGEVELTSLQSLSTRALSEPSRAVESASRVDDDALSATTKWNFSRFDSTRELVTIAVPEASTRFLALVGAILIALHFRRRC